MTTPFHNYSYLKDSVEGAPTLNARKNIISGPRKGDYWFHSPGLSVPEVREEGPLPIQGNIGALLKQEGDNNFSSCSSRDSVAGAPNCTGVFNSDIYTSSNTCDKGCRVNGPESYGIQNFGLVGGEGTNIHGLHAYKNVRAGAEGQGPSNVYGCYESIPSMSRTDGNTCKLDYSTFEDRTVGDFTKLPEFKNLSMSKFKNFQ